MTIINHSFSCLALEVNQEKNKVDALFVQNRVQKPTFFYLAIYLPIRDKVMMISRCTTWYLWMFWNRKSFVWHTSVKYFIYLYMNAKKTDESSSKIFILKLRRIERIFANSKLITVSIEAMIIIKSKYLWNFV